MIPEKDNLTYSTEFGTPHDALVALSVRIGQPVGSAIRPAAPPQHRPGSALFRHQLLFAGALSGALLCQTAVAMQGDVFQPYLGYAWSYDSNLFRLPETQTFLSKTSDSFRRAEGGILIDKYYSRQHVTGNFNLSRTNFSEFTNLDNDAKDAQANWAWQFGNHLEGNLGATYSQALTPNTQLIPGERSIRNQDREFLDAKWRFHPSWSLHGAISHLKLSYDLERQKIGDRSEGARELGLDYLPSSNSSVGVVVRRIRGTYPTQQQVGFFLIDNSYDQNEYQGKVDWQVTGKTHLQMVGGWVERKHDFLPSRDTSNPSFRIIGSQQATGKIDVTMNLWREISPADDLTASYTLNKGASLGATWDAVAKVRVEGLIKYENRDYSNATAFNPASSSPRVDISHFASLSVTWFALQNLQLSTSLFRDNLGSSNPQNGYEANGMSISVRSTF